MPYEDRIPRCFGIADKVFGSHSLERERAREMLTEALQEATSWPELEEAIRDFLKEEGCTQENFIQKQVERAQDL